MVLKDGTRESVVEILDIDRRILVEAHDTSFGCWKSIWEGLEKDCSGLRTCQRETQVKRLRARNQTLHHSQSQYLVKGIMEDTKRRKGIEGFRELSYT
jgi:hypothetical protein